MASWYLTPGTPTISDTQGNTYMLLPPLTGGGVGNGEQTSILIWYALNIAAGPNTVTISGAGIDVGITAVEYSGIAGIGTTSTLPYFGGTPTTTPTSTSFTPRAGSLLFVAFADETNTQNAIAAGSGYTLFQGDGNHVDIEEDNVNSSAGPQTASITVGAATWSWAMYVVEFLPVGGSSTPPIGTVLWSNPGDGSGINSIVPAVPSATGVADVFAMQNDGTVMAVTSDGTTAWTANVQGSPILPDFQGGLVVSRSNGNNGTSIFKLDGITGQAYPTYNLSPNANMGAGNASMAVHTDGTIFAMTGSCTVSSVPPDLGECTESVIGIDPIAGAQKFSVPFVIPRSTPYLVQGGIIAGDGYYYVAFITEDSFGGPPNYIQTNHLSLLRVNSAGASDVLNRFLAFTNSTASEESDPGAVAMITNADTGIFLTLATYDGNPPLLVTTTGTSFSAVRGLAVSGGNGTVVPILQAQDGSFVGSYFDLTTNQTNTVAFDASGNVRWTVSKDTPMIATADGGFIGGSGNTYDQSGLVTGQGALPGQYSWIGNWYGISAASAVQATFYPAVDAADSFAGFAQGTSSPRTTANRPLAHSVQEWIAQTALSYVGSQNWLDTTDAHNVTHYGCNIFVHDVLKQIGLNPPTSPTTPPSWLRRLAYLLGKVDAPGYPARAADWANPTIKLTCWQPVFGLLQPPADSSRPGDTIAQAINFTDASGHVGIVVGPQQTASADSAANCNSGGTIPAGIIDITDFGFRPDGWVSPQMGVNGPCSTSGQKSKAVVKRFVCQ